MIELIPFLQSIGDEMVEYLWFPLLIWTAIALPVALLLNQSESVSPVYQYHSRVALIFTLPAGIVGGWLTDIIASSTTSGNGAVFWVVQNPISVNADPAETSAILSVWEPTVWLGGLGVLLLAGTGYFLMKLVLSYISLKKLESKLDFSPLRQCSDLAGNLPAINDYPEQTLIAYSSDTSIPFTYGWRNTRIVIPYDLKQDTESLSMAVQHELLHIKHRDFLLHSLHTFIKALFWFHPLIHYLHNSAQEFREITCDGEVLSNKQFSKKQYASLLYKLAKREHKTELAMSMAVKPSSLKKRIRLMSSQNNLSSQFRSSFLLTLAFAFIVVLTISCTDISEDGITRSEIEQTQSEMAKEPSAPVDTRPLYIINGEEWNGEESVQKLSRLKPKYIESVDVLKGEKARAEYGERGKNGVIKMSVHNPDKAFTDLQENPPPPQSGSDKEDFFVAVEEMPQLKGSLASLQNEINYPQLARKAGVEGRVIVQFIVNEQGKVEDPQIIRGIGAGCDEEALRVVKKAEFEPGKQGGKPVRVQYSLPITYRLEGGNNDSEEHSSTMPELENSLDELTIVGYI
jgi:TonB family protein